MLIKTWNKVVPCVLKTFQNLYTKRPKHWCKNVIERKLKLATIAGISYFTLIVKCRRQIFKTRKLIEEHSRWRLKFSINETECLVMIESPISIQLDIGFINCCSKFIYFPPLIPTLGIVTFNPLTVDHSVCESSAFYL